MDMLSNHQWKLTFEDFQHKNWMIYWWASEFMLMLWYTDMKSFEKIINKWIKTLTSLWIDVFDNIQKTNNWENEDYKLSRYACYIIAMNWDPKKPEVAACQNYFAEQTRKFEIMQEDPERLSIRTELAEWNKSLSSTVNKHWVLDYAKFNQAWYLWLYNMENYKLAQKRNVDKSKLYDYMGRTELAANLFRVTQTEERIKNRNLYWQNQLEKAHLDVWKEVREFIIQNTWTRPENLNQEMPLPEMKKWLKNAQKTLKAKDKNDVKKEK